MASQPQGTETSSTNHELPAVPLFDNRRQLQELEAELIAAATAVIRSGQYILGPECGRVEERLAEYCQASHGVACASGSDALILALMAVGVGPGDEVIVPSYTFFATASAVARLGATPVFVEIEPRSFNIDPAAIARAINAKTKAIIPVHLFGQCAEMEAIDALAAPRGIAVIEDAAQAIGAEYHGRRAGSLGTMGCFSFYPTKNLGCFGDGGLVTSNDAQHADRVRLLRTHGMQPRYYHHLVGMNSRLDSIQAAILNVKLGHAERWTEGRRERAGYYAELFAETGLDRIVQLPTELPHRRHVWNQFVARIPDGKRNALREHLKNQKIGTEVYYPMPLHRQPCFTSLGYGEGSLPETERAALETVALPIFPELRRDEQQRVVAAMAEFFGVAPRSSAPIAKPHILGKIEHKPSAEQKQSHFAK